MIASSANTPSGPKLCLSIAALWLLGPRAAAEPATFEIDPEHVTVAFLVDHVGYAKVLGRFGTVQGSYRFDEQTGALTDVVVTVETRSVDTSHDERDKHLQSGDFLDSRHFPEMTFTAASARRTGERTFAVDGELELLGKTRPLTLTATWNKSEPRPFGRDDYVMGVSARGMLNRGDFGMSYGLDNGWVGGDVEIIVELEAVRQ